MLEVGWCLSLDEGGGWEQVEDQIRGTCRLEPVERDTSAESEKKDVSLENRHHRISAGFEPTMYGTLVDAELSS